MMQLIDMEEKQRQKVFNLIEEVDGPFFTTKKNGLVAGIEMETITPRQGALGDACDIGCIVPDRVKIDPYHHI